MIIDLHTHSTISDGSLSPEDLVDAAINAGVELLALCDHDSTGDERFISYAKKRGLDAIQGIEVSGEWSKGTCHILGLGIKKGNGPLEEMLAKIIDSRDNRNSHIVAKLNSAGIDITIDEVVEMAGGDVVGRPHMARIMINKGYVKSVQEAFDNYLAQGAPAYVERYRPEPEEAITLLKNAGAKPVIAHPTQLKRSVEEIDAILPKWKEAGLWGIEVYTPYTSDELVTEYLKLAEKYVLKVTGGSDFHGESKPKHFLGELRDGERIVDGHNILLHLKGFQD